MTKSSKAKGPVVEMAASSIDPERERKWRAEDGLRTLTEAERIRGDKSLMGDIEKARKAKMKELDSIQCDVSPRTMGKK